MKFKRKEYEIEAILWDGTAEAKSNILKLPGVLGSLPDIGDGVLKLNVTSGAKWVQLNSFLSLDSSGYHTVISKRQLDREYVSVDAKDPEPLPTLTKEQKFEKFRYEMSELIWAYTNGQDTNLERTSAIGVLQLQTQELIRKGFCHPSDPGLF